MKQLGIQPQAANSFIKPENGRCRHSPGQRIESPGMMEESNRRK